MKGTFPLFLAVVIATAWRGATADEPFELAEVLNGTFSARGIGTTQWVSDYELAILNSTVGIVILNFLEDTTTILVPTSKLAEGGRNTARGPWSLSSDKKFLLWSYNVQTGFRHSTIAVYSVLDISKNTWIDLEDGKHLHLAIWSTGSNALAYVYENNIYYLPDVTAPNEIRNITNDGEEGRIYNGVPDWVYEEEVLSSGSALWFSPNGKYLAFATFDDSEVQVFNYVTYGRQTYPTIEEIRYPKPGTKNPTAKLSVVNLAEPEEEPSLLLKPGSITGELVLQSVVWAQDDILVAIWMNRIQNQARLVAYYEDFQTMSEKYPFAEDNGWVNLGTLMRPVRGVPDEMPYVVLLAGQPISISTDGVYQHPMTICVAYDFCMSPSYPLNDRSVATALYGWTKVSHYIYYQAAPEGKPSQRQIFAVRDTTGYEASCLTCNLTQPDGRACLYASASFSPDLTHAVVTCSGPGPATIRMVMVDDDRIHTIRMLEDNAALRTTLASRFQPVVLNTTESIPGGFEAQVRLWLPPNFKENNKYPMIVYTYGGPGYQQVTDSYTVNWGHYLTTNRGVIYAMIDGRGSGAQGDALLHANYLRLGTAEVIDQIEVTRSLVERYAFIDGERVGIWGWSYGGYATAMALARDTTNAFACGAAVAPVTSWMLYDSIYTERYMSTPQENPEGYANANVSNKIGNFEKHRFLLLHGNADDNVHYQQSMKLVRVLQLKEILFELESYPDENHGISHVIHHVYATMTDFFARCLDLPVEGSLPAAASSPASPPLLLALLLLAALRALAA